MAYAEYQINMCKLCPFRIKPSDAVKAEMKGLRERKHA